MDTMTIPTPRLDLILQTPEETLAWVDALPPEVQVEVSPEWIARVRTSEPGNPWTLSYHARVRDSGVIVGSCAFTERLDSFGVGDDSTISTVAGPAAVERKRTT